MAGAGWRQWTRETLGIELLQDHLQDQAVMRYASQDARNADLVAPTVGMHTFIEADDRTMVYRAPGVWRPVSDRLTVPTFTTGGVGGYEGLEVLETSTGRRFRYGAGAWHPINERFQSGAVGNALSNAAWAGTTYGWVAGLGAKIAVPADGVVRRLVGTAGCSIEGSGWLRLRCDRAGGTTTYYPNSTGLLSSAATQDRMTFDVDVTFDGTQAGSIYLEARASVSAQASFYVPSVNLTAN